MRTRYVATTPGSGITTMGAALLALTALTIGCGVGQGDLVIPRAEIDQRSSAVTTSGAIKSITGTYTSCDGHADASAWSVSVNGGTTNLSIRKNDPDCALTFSGLVVTETVSTTESVAASGSFTAGTAYQLSAVSFTTTDHGKFYANVKLNAASWDVDNVIFTILVSSDAGSGTASSVAPQYTIVSNSVTESAVPAPAYTASLSTVSYHSDAGDTVDGSVSGNLALSGDTAGDGYLIVSGATATSTYAEIDTAWTGGIPTTVSIIDGYTIAAEGNFLSDGDVLPKTMKLIVVNEMDGVRAYQVFTLTFPAPAA